MADTNPNNTVPAWEPRVAVLEQIARDTIQTLADLRQEMRLGFERLERRIERLEDRQDRHFRWLLGIMLGVFALLLSAIGSEGLILIRIAAKVGAL